MNNTKQLFFSIPPLLIRVLRITSFCHMFVIHSLFNPSSNMDPLEPSIALRVIMPSDPSVLWLHGFAMSWNLALRRSVSVDQWQAWGGTRAGYLGCHLWSQGGAAHATKRRFCAPLCSCGSQLAVRRRPQISSRCMSKSLRSLQSPLRKMQMKWNRFCCRKCCIWWNS